MAFDRMNGIIVRAGVVLAPQTTCPIALGDVGDWLDANEGTVKRRLSDGTDIATGAAGDVEVIAVDAVAASALAANVYDNGTAGVGATLTKSTNGSISPVDSATITAGMSILVTAEVTDANNGLYTVTTVGTGSVKYKLTRHPLFNESGNMINGTLFTVKAGSVYAATTWKYTGVDSPVVGTDSLTFAAAPLAITYGAGGDMAASGATTANSAGVANKVSRSDHVHAVDTAVVATLTGSQTLTNKTLTTPVIGTGLTASGATSNDFSGSTGTFKTSTGVLTFGGATAAGATVFSIADPGNAGAIAVTTDGVCNITTAGAETRTLAIPTFVGQRLTICMNVDGGDAVITVASAFNMAANTTITLNDAGDTVHLVGALIAGTRRWRLISNDGATLG